MMRKACWAALAAVALAGMAYAQPARIGHYPAWKPGIQYFTTGSGPTPAFKWGSGSSDNTPSGSQYATFTQASQPAVGDSLFIYLDGIDASGNATHFTGALCASISPAFALVTYAAPTTASSASGLACYRKADGTEPSTFMTPSWSMAFSRGLTAVYVDFSNGSSMDGSTAYVPFAGQTAIASGQITASSGNVLLTEVGNAFGTFLGVTVTPNSGSWTYYYDPSSITSCTTCGVIGIQATTLATSGTTAVQNFTSTTTDYGNTISAAIVP